SLSRKGQCYDHPGRARGGALGSREALRTARAALGITNPRKGLLTMTNPKTLPEPTPGAVHDALYPLTTHKGDNRADVLAKALIGRGCKGTRGASSGDPISVFLGRKFEGKFTVTADEVYWGPDDREAVDLRSDIRAFVREFDAGRYMELIR